MRLMRMATAEPLVSVPVGTPNRCAQDQPPEGVRVVLTEREVTFFRAQGYLLPGRRLFDDAKLVALETIFHDHLAERGDKLSDELDTPHYRDARLFDFLLSDEVLDTVEP